MSIKQIVNERYDVFNVNEGKQPINRNGFGLKNWETLPYDVLVKHHDYKCNRWGIRLGQQTNGKHILSLDFDVCGKPNKDGIRTGCPDTKKLLDKYFHKIDRKDGMFVSSTQGNFNVLVDYSVSNKIKEWVANLGKAKFAIHELEILVAKNQIIPPTATTSKITGTLGPAREFMNEHQFYVIEKEEGFMFEFLQSLFDEHKQKTTPTPAPASTPIPTPKPTPTPKRKIKLVVKQAPEDQQQNEDRKEDNINELEKVKLISQCYSKDRLSNYDSYINFTMAMKNTFGEQGKEIWDKIVSQGNNYNKYKNDEQWFQYTPKSAKEKLLKFGSLMNWAKEDNPELYKRLLNIKDDDKNENLDEWQVIFNKISPEFEKTHAKIINKAVFVKSHENEIIVMSKTQLTTAYEHIQCGFHTGTPVSFISRWTTFNDKIRRYDDMQIYPKPDLCPPNVFNMWIPFKCELYDTPYVENIEGRDFILNHIRILCNNEGIVNDYFIKWIGQMIQYPEFKSICITLISKQGAGKGTLLKLLALMLGEKKVLETRDPARDVWGNFNGIMQNAFLVNLNELSKKDTIEAEGRIKGLITDPTLTINSKGVNQYNINSYHRFITTTNNPDPSKTSEDDRRNLIIRSSDEKIGDKEYFNKLNAYMDDVNVIRTCYDYFKSIPDLDKFGSLSIPKTEYQNNLKELARTPVEQWLEHFTRENINEEQVEMVGKETFDEFEMWRRENNINYDTSTSKLGVALSNLQTNGGITKGRHTKKGDTKYFNIKILKAYFNIGLMIEIDEDTDTDC